MENKDNTSNGNIQKDCENKSELDSLLDDALNDFSHPNVPRRSDTSNVADVPSSEATNIWTDEFIAAATRNFEATMKTIMNQQKESTEEATEDSSNLDLGAMSAEFAKFAETAAKAATEASTDKDFNKCLAETMQQMSKNSEESQAIPTADELEKMFESFGLGGSGSADGTELGGLFPIMQTMLENVLSKDILYPSLKEICAKYPDWLADNRQKLSDEDYTRYNKQYDLMKQVVEEFEKESEEDSTEIKAQNAETVLLLMQKLQELGQPPMDLMGDYETLINSEDKGQLPDLSALLGGVGFPSFGGSARNQYQEDGESTAPSGAADGTECVVM